MSARLHPYASAEPVERFPDDLRLPCGVVLHKPQPWVLWNVGELGQPEWSGLRACLRCLRIMDNLRWETGDVRWLYGLVEGQAERDREAG